MDVYFWRPIYLLNEQRIQNSPWSVVRLGDLAPDTPEYPGIKDGPGGWLINKREYVEKGIPVIRALNISEDGISKSGFVFISPEKHKKLSSTAIEPGDLLLTMRGSIGRAAVVPDSIPEANMNAAICRIRLQDKELTNFVRDFLNSNIGLLQTQRYGHKAVQGDLNLQHIRDLYILIPPRDVREKLVQELEAARAERQRKLAQADALLAGIDEFVLKQLGITLPESTQELAYAIRTKHISRKRLDTYFYSPHLMQTELIVEGFHPEVVPLYTLLATPPINGVDARDFVPNGRIYLRVQNVRPFDIVLDDVKRVQVKTNKDISVKAGDVLLTRKGTFGVAAQVTKAIEGSLISSEIILLRVKEDAKVSSEFLTAWLNCSAAQRLFDRYKSGGIMGHITQGVVKNFPVPVPDNQVQATIVQKIREARNQARWLKQQAEAGWHSAKKRFEQALLGEVEQ